MTLSGATIPGQSGTGSDSHEGVLRIPQRSHITRASPSDCLVSYQNNLWEIIYLCRYVVVVFWISKKVDHF